ncbi:MAG: cytochrome P450 [Chloroflexota bacterium]
MPHPWSMQVKERPYPYFDKWRQESPILWNREMRAFVVTGYKEALSILEDHQTFSSTNSVFNPEAENVISFPSMINIDEPRHKKLRAIAAKAFTPKSLDRDWAPRIQRITREQLAGVGPDVFNVVGDLAFPLPVRMIAEVIGVDSGKYNEFKTWSDHLAQRIGIPESERGGVADMEFQIAIMNLTVYFMQEIEKRCQVPQDDLFTRILEAEVDGEMLTPVEIQAFLVLLLVAGNETTTNLIAHAIRALSLDPALFQAVQSDRTLVAKLIEEALRWEAPIQGFYRKATRDIEISGVQLKAGDPLCVMYAAANRDPAKYECPAEIKLERASREHLAFGKGVHYCLGANLARLEADIALNAVLDHFASLTPVDSDHIAWRQTPFFRGPVEYPVRYTSRVSEPSKAAVA